MAKDIEYSYEKKVPNSDKIVFLLADLGGYLSLSYLQRRFFPKFAA